jgi:hypothetical protein
MCAKKITTYFDFIKESEEQGLDIIQLDFIKSVLNEEDYDYDKKTRTVTPKTKTSFKFPGNNIHFNYDIKGPLNLLGLNFDNIDNFKQ